MSRRAYLTFQLVLAALTLVGFVIVAIIAVSMDEAVVLIPLGIGLIGGGVYFTRGVRALLRSQDSPKDLPNE